MKRIVLLMLLVVSLSASAQTANTEKPLSQSDSLTWAGTKWLEQIELNLSLKERYKLYPTQNMYTFLLVDKTTGRIWHVQWGLESSKRGIWKIY